MSLSNKGRRGPTSLDPRVTRVATIIGWCWLAVCLVAAIVSTASASRLPASVWYFFAGGRGATSTVYRFATTDLLRTWWILLVVFAVVLVLGQFLASPRRAWLLLLVIVVSVLCVLATAGLFSSVQLQLGDSSTLGRAQALAHLRGSGQFATFAGGIVAVITLVGIPAFVARRSPRPRPSTAR